MNENTMLMNLFLPKRFRLFISHEIHWKGPPSLDALFVMAGALSALSLKNILSVNLSNRKETKRSSMDSIQE
jgi:hypothetical protein